MQRYYFFILTFLPFFVSAQIQIPERGEVFRNDVVPEIYLEIAPADLDSLLAPGNEFENDPYSANLIFDNTFTRDTIENIGLRLRGNTSRTAAKKSFKLDINAFEDQDLYGLEKLNINGEHNDPSVSRSRICWDILRWFDLPGSRTNHVNLYINETYIGVFANVEHFDENFLNSYFGNDHGNLYKCVYPADLKYLGANPDLYKQEVFGRRPYDLRNNEARDDYRDFAEFVDILNNTAIENLECELERVLNVESLLKYIAFDVLTGNWDGPHYNKNNFYLYQNPASGRFEYIPYDLDNTLGIDWLNRDWGDRDMYDWGRHGDSGRPLYFRVLEVPSFRQRYSRYTAELLEIFNSDNLFSYFDEMRDQISAGVQSDIVYSLDYGFSFSDFNDAWDSDLDYFQTDYSIKDFVNARFENSMEQLELENLAPTLEYAKHNFPANEEDLIIQAKVSDNANDFTVNLCYNEVGEGITCVPLFDDGLNGDEEVNDGIFGLNLGTQLNLQGLEYFFELVDNEGLVNRIPTCDKRMIRTGDSDNSLVINEILASNTNIIADQAGEFEDYIELFNRSNETIFLGDYYISDNRSIAGKWRLPALNLAPNDYYLIIADNDPEQGENHANFKLAAGGEEVGLFLKTADAFTLADFVKYAELGEDEALARIPNGTGEFLNFNPTPDAHNEGLSIENEQLIDIEWLIKPNPNHGQFTIETSHDFIFGLQITDARGNVIAQDSPQNNSNSYNYSSLNAGLYFVKITDEKGHSSTRKLIVY